MPWVPEHPGRPAARPDEESRAWLTALTSNGMARDQAVGRLYVLLLRAARFEVTRRRAMLAQIPHAELEDLAVQSADDALVAVLRRLGDFRGESRFTTWVYKFAILEAAVKVRRRAWQGREVPLEPDHWLSVVDANPSPLEAVEHGELRSVLRQAIVTALTPHQRTVLVALALQGVPIDVLAERLGTSRGALYKTLHDARQKLRARLSASGFAPGRNGGERS